MERESNPMEALCRSGCGFYGNPATEGLCSVCFKEAVKKKQQPPASTPSPSAASFAASAPVPVPVPVPVAVPATPLAAAAPTVPALPTSIHSTDSKLEDDSGAGSPGSAGVAGLDAAGGATTSSGAGAAATSDTDPDDKDPSKDKKKKNRCAVCRKKVGLTGFECRCGGLFCALHRYSDKHECSFDYRELGAQEIRRNNPVVVSQKIHKI